MLKRVLFSLTLVLAAQPVIDACTTFCVRAGDAVLFGRNYDFEIGDGMVMVNPAGAEKKGHLEGGPSWRSKYGSVTFNQFGRGFPMGGLNQAGVVIELMWLDDTEYPARDQRSPLTVLEWIQYQLDTAASVADVIASDARVRIQGQTPLHYLVGDRSGGTATIEFLNGKLVTHKGADLPFTALANHSYAKSSAFVEARGRKPAGGSGSLERFSRAALAMPAVASAGSTGSSQAAVDRAFAGTGRCRPAQHALVDRLRAVRGHRPLAHRPASAAKISQDGGCEIRLRGRFTGARRPCADFRRRAREHGAAHRCCESRARVAFDEIHILYAADTRRRDRGRRSVWIFGDLRGRNSLERGHALRRT